MHMKMGRSAPEKRQCQTHIYLVALSRQPRHLFVTRCGRLGLLLREFGLQSGEFGLKHAAQLVVCAIIVGGLRVRECVTEGDDKADCDKKCEANSRENEEKLKNYRGNQR
jgi:hypothetical protein